MKITPFAGLATEEEVFVSNMMVGDIDQVDNLLLAENQLHLSSIPDKDDATVAAERVAL